MRNSNVALFLVSAQSQDGEYDIGNTHKHGNYLFGEQGVRGKDSILQVNLMKELVVRTVSNQ